MDELPVFLVMRGHVAGLEVHELDHVVDLTAHGLGVAFGEDVLLAQDRYLVLDRELGDVFAVLDERAADQDGLAGLERDFEWHGVKGVHLRVSDGVGRNLGKNHCFETGKKRGRTEVRPLAKMLGARISPRA